ncbi:hypothetical protein GCM10022243_48190 [Saccharothrix violaceirubra]|uniref:Uncharacterized protein n=1 Tax=Saccharothrix violaceirubra TaxID=413306 RepID=A0A7W7SZM3_9PSEU|nr:hypothetical protein [Saccharothrix violaceirubra]MBB4963839.1 hypothetical protein [Saccharothrix violaceirubra]
MSIIRLRDVDGDVHYTEQGSQAARRLLDEGAVDLDAPTTGGEVAADAAPAGPGDDHDPAPADDGPGQRKRAARTADRGAEPPGAA